MNGFYFVAIVSVIVGLGFMVYGFVDDDVETVGVGGIILLMAMMISLIGSLSAQDTDGVGRDERFRIACADKGGKLQVSAGPYRDKCVFPAGVNPGDIDK